MTPEPNPGHPHPQGTPGAPGQPAPNPSYPQPIPPHLAQQPQPDYPQQPQPVAQPIAPQPTAPQPIQPQPVYPQQPQHAHPQAAPQPIAPQPVHPQPQPAYPQPQPVPVAQPMAPQPVAPQAPLPPQAPMAPQAPQPVAPQAPLPPQAPMAPQPAAPQPASPAPARPVPVPANRPMPVPVGGGHPTSDPQPIIRDEAAHDDDEEEDDDDAVTSDVLKAAPPWMVSLLVHMGLMIVLALIVLTTQTEKPLEVEVVYAEKEGEQLEDDTLDLFSPDPMDELVDPIFSKDLMEVMDPLAAPPDIPTVDEAMFNTSAMEAPSIGMALSGREKGAKSALLAAYGGTATTEAAVLNALKWLKKQQQADGSWSLKGPYSGGAINENKPAATAMALLAFQGAGNTHLKGEFKLQVSRGVEALLKMMDADGSFYQPGSPANHRLYTQAQCTIALCELYGMTKDEKIKAKAQLALDYAARIQSPEGGWRYRPRSDSDTSVTGWFVMALQSGLMSSDLAVKQETLNNVTKYLDAAQSESGAKYAYQPGEGPTLAMTAEGLLCRQYLGWVKDNSALRRGVDYLLANNINAGQKDVYYWYYGTQVMHHMGGDDWDKWNDVMRVMLPASQVDSGPEAGSWNPERDQWGHHGGRLYVTCLSVFMLEVYYRHLPIYKHL